MTKIGEVYWRDEDGALWFAETFVDKKGVTSTQQTLIEPAQEPV